MTNAKKYDKSISSEKKKQNGVFYSPQTIVKYIVKQTIDSFFDKKIDFDKLQNIKILDPSCGDGMFLIESYVYLLDLYKFNFSEYKNPEKFIIQNNLFGVDIDNIAVELTKKNLFEISNYFCNNIKTGNSLISDKTVSEHAFVWENEFSEIMQNGGFDIVVGNPPYGGFLNLEQQNYLTENYKLGTSETAICFIKQAFNLSKSKSIVSYIVPKSFSYASNYKTIRDFTWHNLMKLVDCKKVWNEVKLEQVIIIFDKFKEHKFYETAILENNSEFIELGKIEKEKSKQFGFFLNGISDNEIFIAEKILKKSVFLNQIAENIPGVPNQKYIVSENKINRFTEYYEMIGGAEISKFEIKKSKGKIEKKWVEHENAFVKPNSILVQRIVAHIENPISHLQITACIPDIKYIGNLTLANTINQILIKDIENFSQNYLWYILNSKIINWYAFRFIYAKAIRTMQFYNPVTSRLPIPNVDKNFQNLFNKKIKNLFEFNNEILKLNKQFNAVIETFIKKEIPNNFKKWYSFEWNKFYDKITSNKINISLEKTIELSEYFEKSKIQYINKNNEIIKIENELDKFLYDFLEITKEEIEIIEK